MVPVAPRHGAENCQCGMVLWLAWWGATDKDRETKAETERKTKKVKEVENIKKIVGGVWGVCVWMGVDFLYGHRWGLQKTGGRLRMSAG